MRTIQAARNLHDQQNTEHEPDEHNRYRNMIMMANDGIMVIQENKLVLVNPALLIHARI